MDKIASSFKRGLGYLADCCLSFVFFQFFLSSNFLNELVTDLNQFLPSIVSPQYSSKIIHLSLFIFVVTQFRFIFTLLWGESLGQFLMGIYGAGGHFWKRIGGGARVQLELLTTPLFVLFDFPVLFRRRGLKEFLSITALRSQGQVRFFFSFFFILPALLFIATISPLLQDYTYFMGMPIKSSKSAPEELTDKTDFSKFATYRSSSFHFLTLSSLGTGRFLLIPSYSVEKHNGEFQYLPLVHFYDTKLNHFVSLKKSSDVDLFSILSLGRNYNPLFFARYPELAIALAKDPQIFERRGYRSEYGNRGILDQALLFQVRGLIESSVGLGLNQIFEHVLNQGPFIKGAIDLRDALFKEIGFEKLDGVELAKLGDQYHMIFSGSTTDEEGKVIIHENMLGLESFHPGLLTLSTDRDGAPSLLDLRNEFFSSASWFFDYNDVFTPPIRYEDLDPLLALDYLGNERLKTDKRKLVEDYLYHHYFDLCKIAVVKKNDKLADYLITALNRHTLVSTKLWEKNLVGRDYVSFIQALKVSLKNRDRRYFGLK